MPTITLHPTANGDDGHGDGTYTSASAFLANDIAIRFPSAGIPQGATIVSATLTLYQYDSGHSASLYDVAFSDEDDAAQIADFADFSGRPRTSTVAWVVDGYAGDDTPITTPSLTAILQAVVNRAGFDSTSALMVFVERSAIQSMVVSAFDAGSFYADLDVQFDDEESSSSQSISESSASSLSTSSASSSSTSSVSSQSGESTQSSASSESSSQTEVPAGSGTGRRCRGCCGDCIIDKDNFNRADADDPGEHLTEIGGSDYDVVGNALLCVVGGLLICDIPHPHGNDGPQRVRRQFKLTSATGYARVIVGYQSEDDYLYASVEMLDGCWVLRLFEVIAGIHTEVQEPQAIGDGVELNEWHRLEACLDIGTYPNTESLFTARVQLATGMVYRAKALPGFYAGGERVGIDDSAGTWADNFVFEWMDDDNTPGRDHCPTCDRGNADCVIDTDTFPNGSDTPCKWDAEIFRAYHPDLRSDQRVSATFSIDTGQTAQIRINSTRDGTDYYWASVSLSSTLVTLSIGRAGTTLLTDSNTFSGTPPVSMTLCLENIDGMLLACVGSLILTEEVEEITSGWWSGKSGTVTWQSYTFSVNDTDLGCPHCECGTTEQMNCCPGEDPLELPPFYILRLEAVANDGCTGCNAINKNWLLQGGMVDAGGTAISGCYSNTGVDADAFENIGPCANFGGGGGAAGDFNMLIAVEICQAGGVRCSQWNTTTNWTTNPALWTLHANWPKDEPYDDPDDPEGCSEQPHTYSIMGGMAFIAGAPQHPFTWFAVVSHDTSPADLIDQPMLPGASKLYQVGFPLHIPLLGAMCNISASTGYLTAVGP